MAEDQDTLLRLIAKLYYLDDLGQDQVAGITGISRSQVSRMLARARERGIVQITVDEYDPRDSILENKIKSAFSLQHVFVIKTLKNSTPGHVCKTVGYFGAPFISELIHSNCLVGVAGGRTVCELVECMTPVAGVQGITVAQLMGNIGPQISKIDAFELSHKLAEKFKGSFYTLNAPAHVQDSHTRDVFVGHDHVRAIWQLYKQMQIALVGIGSLCNSSFVERGMLDAKGIQELKDRGAVGEICGRYFDEAGEECVSAYRERVISIGLDELRRTPDVFGVVAPGQDRVDAIYAAAKSGLITSLLIDDAGAAALVARIRKTSM